MNKTQPNTKQSTDNNLHKLKWSMYNDSDFMRQKVYWLGPFRLSTSISGHGIMVFGKRIKSPIQDYASPAKYTTRYTVAINCGPHGETGESVILPFQTTLAQAKAKAIELANKYIAAGYEFKE